MTAKRQELVTTQSEKHFKNAFLIVRKAVFIILASALCSIASVLLVSTPETYMASAALLICAAVLAVLAVPFTAESLVRLIEYDRLINELDRINAASILNIKIDKLYSKYALTNGRRRVLALGLSTLKHAPAQAQEFVKSVYQTKPSHYGVLAKKYTKDWLKAVFTPVRCI